MHFDQQSLLNCISEQTEGKKKIDLTFEFCVSSEQRM